MSELPDLPHYVDRRPTRRRWWPAGLAVLAVIAIAAGAWLFGRPEPGRCSDCAPAPAAGAKSMLHASLAAAKTYSEENDTMLGFNATKAHRVEPSITFNKSSQAAEGQVSIRDVGPSSVLFVTSDAQGEPWCVASTLLGDSSGRGDVATAAECVGGW